MLGAASGKSIISFLHYCLGLTCPRKKL